MQIPRSLEPVEKLGKVEPVALIFWWPIENLIPSVTAYFYEYDPTCFFGNDLSFETGKMGLSENVEMRNV